jgi:hypothetical protein
VQQDGSVDDALVALLVKGQGALASGDWADARACFEEATRREHTGETLDGLAQALFGQGDYAAAIDSAELAFAAFHEAGNEVRAAVCARFIGYLYAVVHGNHAAASGWMGRAIRLIEAAGDCPERARIELTRAVISTEPAARDRHLAAAVEIAQRYGDTDLVLDATSQQGLHLVAAGEVDAGMALLDESLAAVAAGEVRDLVSVGAMYCKMLHACELTFDVRRAEDWLALADRFVQRTNRIPISAICRTHYGGVAGRTPNASWPPLSSSTTGATVRCGGPRSSGWPRSGCARAGSRKPRSCSQMPSTTATPFAQGSSCTWPAANPTSRCPGSSGSSAPALRPSSPPHC